MRANIRVIKKFSEISQEALLRYCDTWRTKEQLQKIQEEHYFQLNPYTLREVYNPNTWCNGVFLTKEGHALLKKVVKIADHYNFDDSDSMTDYYSVNFSFHIELGKWNKPFVDGE